MSRPHEAHKDILPFIFTAANRSLPNLNLLQVIVETFHADVNVRMYETVEQPHHSVLHILAIGKHWWHTEAIKYVLERGADVMMRDAEGHTPLHIAVTGGYCRLQIARVLLEHGADANAFNHTGVTPLGLAAGNSEMVRLLLQHGGRVELGSKPILFEAITCQDIDSVRAIIESGFDIQQPFKTSLAELDLFKKQKMIPVSRRQLMPDADELNRMEMKHQQELSLLLCRPLHYASRGRFNKVTERHKAVAIVELLLSHGADPLLSYGENSTVIHDVLTQGGIVEPLLALPNLELETRDGRGRTLLLAACEVAEEDSLLLPQKHDNFELHPSGTAQKIFTVDRLCEMGAEVSVVDEAGNNPLHFLVTPGAYKPSARLRMSLLIGKCPALVHQQNQFGETPLHLAMKNHEWDLMRILLDASADASASDAEGNTVVHHIAGGLNADTRLWAQFRQFLEQGLEINARNHDGETPVFKYIRSLRCRESLRGPVFDGLVASGTDVFVRNQEGESLLHIVAKLPCSSAHGLCRGKEKFAESFSYLMELGLDPAQEDKNQRTPVVCTFSIE
jgi:ankyrin repeat protein